MNGVIPGSIVALRHDPSDSARARLFGNSGRLTRRYSQNVCGYNHRGRSMRSDRRSFVPDAPFVIMAAARATESMSLARLKRRAYAPHATKGKSTRKRTQTVGRACYFCRPVRVRTREYACVRVCVLALYYGKYPTKLGCIVISAPPRSALT